MPQPPEAQAFITRVQKLPPGPGAAPLLSQVLQPSIEDEAELRKLWATDRSNVRLNDPHVGLVDIFDAPDDIRTTRARVVADDADLATHFIHHLPAERRRGEGAPATVPTLDAFKKNWAVFTEGSLSQLTDWSNVVAAGGAVQACLAPLPASAEASRRALRKHYHNVAFPTSDVDLFLYGLTPAEAEKKMQAIYEAVRDSVPWDVTCVRTKHTVSIHSQYPYRSVQIVLRLYSSPAEILAGFDVDAPCCAYDGARVWANPRALVAMMRQCNTVDMTRRSPSYEVRLTKYSMRDFEVYVPSLKREDADPTLFERSIQRVQGLARLLVLEKLIDSDTRQRYLSDRRRLRSRPDTSFSHRHMIRKLKGDLKANTDIGGIEMNDYDTVSLHIPYGAGWDARRIEKLVFQTDLSMNSPYNPKNKDRRLHRHPAYFGTLAECLEDCCEFCPEPEDDEERALQEVEEKSYVRGRIQFIEEDPGRQSMSGSFNPIDEGEWAEQAYLGATEKLFNAIVAGDRDTAARLVAQEGFDIDRRDHVGRTALQVTVLAKEQDIACDLIDAGARMTCRIVDGRTALHLAARHDLPRVIHKLLERSAVNDEKAKAEEEAKNAAKKAEEDVAEERTEDEMDVDEEENDEDDESEKDSSEDDWSSEGDEEKNTPKEPQVDTDQLPEDEEDVPDVFEIDATDWDRGFTPLQYAVIFGALSAVDALLAGGADATIVTQSSGQGPAFHPLTLTTITRDQDVASEVLRKLVAAGASSSQADDNLYTLFHRVVCAKKPKLVESLLATDPNAKAVIDSPYVEATSNMVFPILSALGNGDFATMAILLAHGAKVSFTEEMYSNAKSMRKNLYNQDTKWSCHIPWPLESALARRGEDYEFLIDIGADFNKGVQRAYYNHTQPKDHKSLLDVIRDLCDIAKRFIAETEKFLAENSAPLAIQEFGRLAEMNDWKGELGRRMLALHEAEEKEDAARCATQDRAPQFQVIRLRRALAWYEEVEKVLVENGAKTWLELHPDDEDAQREKNTNYFDYYNYLSRPYSPPVTLRFFMAQGDSSNHTEVPTHLVASYEALFQACVDGDDAKIEELCLPKDRVDPAKPLIAISSRYGEAPWGHTPLSLAVENRHWSTARVILAVALAQYKPKDAQAPRFKLPKISLDNESESDDSDDDDMDDDEDKPDPVNFIDLARRPSEIKVAFSPDSMLNETHWYEDPKARRKMHANLITKAIVENDFEAFVQIADLFKSLPGEVNMDIVPLATAIIHDRPEMLDEIIRRFGAGIDVPVDDDDDENETIADGKKPSSKRKMYLGLNVHGKKRKDLVAKTDPDAPVSYGASYDFIHLWRAAHEGAAGCVRYLATERPVEAYRYYAATHNDARAQCIRRIGDQLPQKLGWSTNALNESAVTTAVMGNQLDILKMLVDLRPAQIQSMLMTRIHYVGFNHLSVAATFGSSPELFDYLLSKGVSPTETDCRGWNICHLLVTGNHSVPERLRLLKHILSTLPEDVVTSMMLQQSKGALNAPLHLAVKDHSLASVKLLLQSKAPMFLLRDRKGRTAFHIAVHERHPDLTRLLAEAGPDEMVTAEDGVGNTAYETAVTHWLESAANGLARNVGRLGTLNNSIDQFKHRRGKPPSREDAQALADTVARLHVQGRLRDGTQLATALEGLVKRVRTASEGGPEWTDPVEELKTKKEAEDGEDEEKKAEGEFGPLCARTNELEVLEVIEEIARAKPGMRRQLIHLIDVHQSVQGSLDSSAGAARNVHYNRVDRAEGGLDPEVVVTEEDTAKGKSALKWYFGGPFDPFGDDTM